MTLSTSSIACRKPDRRMRETSERRGANGDAGRSSLSGMAVEEKADPEALPAPEVTDIRPRVDLLNSVSTLGSL